MANPYPAEIADPGDGIVRLAGNLTFTDPANQPGGGSVPQIEQTFSASEVAARYDADLFVAALTLDGVAVGDVMLGLWVAANTLDENGDLSDSLMFTFGQTTADVAANGVSTSAQIAWDDETFGLIATLGQIARLATGSTLYAVIGADAAPTAGSITLRAIVLQAP